MNIREIETGLFKRHTQRFTTINFAPSEANVVLGFKDDNVLFFECVHNGEMLCEI